MNLLAEAAFIKPRSSVPGLVDGLVRHTGDRKGVRLATLEVVTSTAGIGPHCVVNLKGFGVVLRIVAGRNESRLPSRRTAKG